jgi:hypothetical protein
MTETITHPRPSIEAAPDEEFHPADILLHLTITLLAPMFLLASGGNIMFARMAALQTVTAYHARTDEDMIAIVQIIAFGLAALASLSRSMEDDLSLAMTLRLRGNANACNRSAEQNRRALRESRTGNETLANVQPAVSLDDGYDETELMASVAEALRQTGQTRPPKQETMPARPAVAPAAPAVPPNASERQIEVAWAAGMARAAAAYTADLPNLAPAERRAATIRATALSRCAHDLMAGNVGPRPRPGDLAALTRPNQR